MKIAASNVVLVGPDAKNYRGGIAQFTSRLAAELAQHCELSFFSWKELYPRFLISRENPAPAVSSFTLPTSMPTLSYSLPWTWKATADKIAAQSPQQIFLTWSHPVHAPVYLALIAMLRRKTNAEIVAICHNVSPHETFPFAQKVSRRFFNAVDRIIVHGQAESAKLLSLQTKARCSQLFMPVFDLFSPVGAMRENAKPRILFFGNIRPYKGLDTLLLAVPKLLEKYPELKLKIAGEAFFESSSWLARMLSSKSEKDPLQYISELGIASAIELDLRYIPDNEIPALFAEADAVIYPFKSCSGSASLSLALALGKPVVATNVGNLASIVQTGVNGVLVAPEDPDELARGISALLENLPGRFQVMSSISSSSWQHYCELALEHSIGMRKYA